MMYGNFLYNRTPKGSFYFVSDKDRAQRYRNEILTCNGKEVLLPVKTPEEISQPPDLLIVALKGPKLIEGLQTVKGVIGPNTTIISVMNGISSEEIIEKELGTSRIIHCVAQRMDALFQNGVLTCGNFGELVLGLSKEHANEKEALEATEAFFREIGMPFVHDDEIIHRMWCKWMLNVGVNQTLAVFDDVFARVHQPGEARDTLIGAMREVLEISKKEGTAVTEEDFREYLRIIDELNPAGMPSMRQDRLAKRKTEVDLFAGTVIEKAEKYGVDVPFNRMLYKEIKNFESTFSK